MHTTLLGATLGYILHSNFNVMCKQAVSSPEGRIKTGTLGKQLLVLLFSEWGEFEDQEGLRTEPGMNVSCSFSLPRNLISESSWRAFCLIDIKKSKKLCLWGPR